MLERLAHPIQALRNRVAKPATVPRLRSGAPNALRLRSEAMVLSSTTETHHDWVQRRKFGTPVERAEVAADWQPRGFSCALFTDPPGREWNDFTHKADELVTVVQGRMRFTVGGDEVVLEPGDEVFIPAGVTHSTKNVGEGEAQWLYGYG